MDDIHDILHYVNFANDIDSTDLRRRPSMYNWVQDQEDNDEKIKEIESEIKNQIYDLNNLGQDFVSDNEKLIPNTLLINILNYINDNIFSIAYIDIICEDKVRLRSLGRSIYQILYVDFINETFKFLCNALKVKYSNDILAFSDDIIKSKLITIYSDLSKQASALSKINPSIINSTIKYSQAVDLFDNDISDFKENFLIPVIEKYSTTIDSQLI